MYLRGHALLRSTPQNEDYHLAAAIGLVLAAYVGFFLYLYWLMQPTVSASPGVAGYRPPPKTVVRPADLPSVPPAQPEALPAAEPASAMAKSNVAEKPKKQIKETKRQEARTTRRARPVREQPAQPSPFWGYASSSRSYGSLVLILAADGSADGLDQTYILIAKVSVVVRFAPALREPDREQPPDIRRLVRNSRAVSPASPHSLAAMKPTTFDSDCICLTILPTSSLGSLVSERRMR